METMNKIKKLLEELITIHEQLIEVSNEKTEIIKSGEMERIQRLLTKERKYVSQLELIEQERTKMVKTWFLQQKVPLEDMTMTRMLQVIKDDKIKRDLEVIVTTLVESMTQLKQQEQLNSELILQSLQFVQFSLDLLDPSLAHMNYGKKQSDELVVKRSAFDSKV